MTLKEKVGQLFVINGFGDSLRDRDPEMVRLNRRFYGVSNIARLIRKFDPGGIIYFDWSNGLEEPERIARLSNGIQRIARSRLPRQHGAGGGAQRQAGAAGGADHGRRAAGDGGQRRQRARGRPSLEAAIGAGADQVMVTHIVFPKITGKRYPSSLLPYWVNGQPRKRLGFRGVAVTDALDAASLDAFTPTGVALRAQRAGNDLPLEIADPEELEGSDKPPANLLAARRALIRAVKRDPSRMRALKRSPRPGGATSSSSPPSTSGPPARPARSSWSTRCWPPASRSSSPRSARPTTSPTCPPRPPSSPASTTSRSRWKR